MEIENYCVSFADVSEMRKFYADMGYANVEYHVVDGRLPCAIAVITKKEPAHEE